MSRKVGRVATVHHQKFFPPMLKLFGMQEVHRGQRLGIILSHLKHRGRATRGAERENGYEGSSFLEQIIGTSSLIHALL